jgi:hypothetical protein
VTATPSTRTFLPLNFPEKLVGSGSLGGTAPQVNHDLPMLSRRINLADGVARRLLHQAGMNTETATDGQEQWTACGCETWALQTSDGFLGRAHWSKDGAAITVTKPDGTDLLRKSWGSRQIFLDSWHGMFEWLKGRVRAEIAAERGKPAVTAEPVT